MDFSNVNAASLNAYHQANEEVEIIAEALHDKITQMKLAAPMGELKKWWKTAVPNVEVKTNKRQEMCAYITSLVLSMPAFDPPAFFEFAMHDYVRAEMQKKPADHTPAIPANIPATMERMSAIEMALEKM